MEPLLSPAQDHAEPIVGDETGPIGEHVRQAKNRIWPKSLYRSEWKIESGG